MCLSISQTSIVYIIYLYLLYLYLSIYLSLKHLSYLSYIYIYVYLYLSIYISIDISIFMYISIFLNIFLSKPNILSIPNTRCSYSYFLDGSLDWIIIIDLNSEIDSNIYWDISSIIAYTYINYSTLEMGIKYTYIEISDQ